MHCLCLQMKQYFRDKLKSDLKDKNQMFDEQDVDIISDITDKSMQAMHQCLTRERLNNF